MTARSSIESAPVELRGPITARAWRRTLTLAVSGWILLAAGPQLLGLSAPWRAFAAGLSFPGAGLLYAIPPVHHGIETSMVVGHAVLITVEVGAVAWLLRRKGFLAATVVLVAVVALGVALATAPGIVVVGGHVAAFCGVVSAAVWALIFRAIARSDHVTLPAIIVVSAAAAAVVVVVHGHGRGPADWVSWAAPVVALGITVLVVAREAVRHRAARRVGAERDRYLDERRAESARTDVGALARGSGTDQVTEADLDQLRLLRYLMSVAIRGQSEDWAGFDAEGPGPLQQYRYQLNALGWALSIFGYAHTPAYRGALHQAQLDLFARIEDPRAWGYWYRQNLLGNWDFRQRRADPIDVAQNIMFTGYLNLQLGMFGQATGDTRFDEPGALRLRRSATESFDYDQHTINDIVVRNFGGDLCLWPCEPLPIGRGRRHGLVFPYCNAVSAAGVAVLDARHGTKYAADIAARLERQLRAEFTAGDGDLVAFLTSGLGLVARSFRGPTATAAIAAFLAPLLPDLAWRAWEILRREWLETGKYRSPGSGGVEAPTTQDWATAAVTNTQPLAGALLLAQECGHREWHAELWAEARKQLDFAPDEIGSGIWRFERASVHGNGMLGLGGLGRAKALTDMMSRPRPAEWSTGPRISRAPHPHVLVARAVSDGIGLDLVLYPGERPGRFVVCLDQLVPRRCYRAHGAVESDIRADEHGGADLVVDLAARTPIVVRPLS